MINKDNTLFGESIIKEKQRSDVARKINGDNGNREENDFYPTPDNATKELLKIIKINGSIWECACGDGAISKLLPQEDLISTDLIYRGYGEGGVDFLKTNKSVDWIITNPPYGLATEFAIHSLYCANNVALLLKIQFLEGASRHKFFMQHPPKSVNVFSKRLKIYKNGLNTGASSMMCFAWFIWEKGFNGSPIIKWI